MCKRIALSIGTALAALLGLGLGVSPAWGAGAVPVDHEDQCDADDHVCREEQDDDETGDDENGDDENGDDENGDDENGDDENGDDENGDGCGEERLLSRIACELEGG